MRGVWRTTMESALARELAREFPEAFSVTGAGVLEIHDLHAAETVEDSLVRVEDDEDGMRLVVDRESFALTLA